MGWVSPGIPVIVPTLNLSKTLLKCMVGGRLRIYMEITDLFSNISQSRHSYGVTMLDKCTIILSLYLSHTMSQVYNHIVSQGVVKWNGRKLKTGIDQ